MRIEYSLEEQDFLVFQLFTASKSDRINKKKRNGWILLTVGALLITVYFYLSRINSMAIYFGIVVIVTGLFYPKYFRWRYKKHYHTYIIENYSKRFGELATLEFNPDSIFSRDKTGEGKLNLSEIEKVDETKSHFFLKVSTGMSLIIPKNKIDNPHKLGMKFRELRLTVNDENNWSWD